MTRFRWLGVAGVELDRDGQVLLVDPFFTRPPLWKLFNHMGSNTALITREIRPASAILVTHSHWDHLMDAASVARVSGAPVYGSNNTCRILKSQGLPDSQIRSVSAGDRLHFGGWTVTVFAGHHGRTPIDAWINAPLSPRITPPLRLIDYHKDEVFAYRFSTGSLTLLHGTAGTQADILFMNPGHSLPEIFSRVDRIRPQLVIPIHWDDFMRPLSQPLRPMLNPPSWIFPWISRINLSKFKHAVEAKRPGVKVLIAELFRPYLLEEFIGIKQVI